MKAYGAIFSARFRTLLQYRTAAVAGCVTQVFWGLIRMMIFTAFYASTSATQPMTLSEVVTYVWLGQATLLLVLFRPDREVRDMIRSGTVAYELVRPVDLYRLWYARSLAARTAPTLLRMMPILLIGGLFFGMRAPVSLGCGGLWVLSTLAAVLLSSAIGTLMTVSMLWTISGEGVNRLTMAALWILSGIVVPLPLFPDWMQPLLSILPFRGMMDTPFRIYMAHIPPAQAAGAIVHQLAWTLGLVTFGRWLLARATRALVVQGG